MTSNITQYREKREQEIKQLIRSAAERLPQPAEERDQDGRFAEIVDKISQKHNQIEAKRNLLQKEIKRLEDRLGGLLGTKYSNGFGLLINSFSFLAAVFAMAELIIEKLIPVEDDDDTKRGLGIGFAVMIVAFGILYMLGNTIHYIGTRAWQKRNHYKELSWDEKKDLQKFIHMFKEIVSINSESDEENLKHKFKQLIEILPDMPKKCEGVRIIRTRDDVISYIILSLPKDHPVRKKLEELDEFTEAPLDSSLPPSLQPEPEITTYARRGLSGSYLSFIKKAKAKKELEGHLTSRDDVLSNRQMNRLNREYRECQTWLDIESYIGGEIPHFLIRGKKIKKKSVFNQVGYHEFRKIYHSDSEPSTSRDESSDSEYDIESQQ